MFQNGISRNTKCDNMVRFSKSSHIYTGKGSGIITKMSYECKWGLTSFYPML